MKISKLLYSLLIGLTIYSLLIFYEGDTGLKALAKVENYRKVLNDNLDNIRDINEGLTVEFDSLSTDNDLIKLKARALGYFEREDHLVHITNWNPDYNEYKPGHVIKQEYLTDVDEKSFRLMAFSATLFSLIILIIAEMSKKTRR